LAKNCWEFHRCEYGPDSKGIVCPVVRASAFNGMNRGINGGRSCWKVPETPICRYKYKFMDCMVCGFFRTVREEEGSSFEI